MKSPTLFYLVPAAALAVGSAVGWFTAPKAGTQFTPPPSTAVQSKASASTEPLPPAPASSPSSATAAPHASPDVSIDAILRYPSALHRTAALKRYFDAMPLSEFTLTFAKLKEGADADTIVLEMLARAWAERDPQAGSRALLGLPAGLARSRSLTAFARAWGRLDAASAGAWAERNLTGADLRQVQSYFKTYVAPKPPETSKSFEEILATTDRDERHRRLSEYFRKAVETDPAKALEQVTSLPIEQDRMSMRVSVASDWARKDPSGFLKWLKNRETGADWKEKDWNDWILAISNASSTLAEKDLGLLRETLNSWPDGRVKNYLATNYAAQLSRRDPDAAIAFVEEIRLTIPDFGYSTILQGVLQKDPEKGKELLQAEIANMVAKSTYQVGDRAANLMKPWIQKDAAATAEFATTLSPKVMPDVFYEISKEWCNNDGQAALNWATALPAGDAKEHALRQFTYTWAKHDTNKSTVWLNSLPKDTYRWAATEGFVCSIFDADPDAALGWARSIPDEKKRLNIVANAWNAWSQNNSKSAWDWLSNSELSDQEREAIFNRQR